MAGGRGPDPRVGVFVINDAVAGEAAYFPIRR
jgi:hypothetical protein